MLLKPGVYKCNASAPSTPCPVRWVFDGKTVTQKGVDGVNENCWGGNLTVEDFKDLVGDGLLEWQEGAL